MDEKCGYKTPTPADSLEQQIIDPSFPKNEREWWASEEITRLRAEVEALRADAERWEHARSIACFTEDRDMGPGGWWTVAVHVKRRPAANTIDAAVDASTCRRDEPRRPHP